MSWKIAKKVFIPLVLVIATVLVGYISVMFSIIGLFIARYLGIGIALLGIGIIVSLWLFTYLKNKRKLIGKVMALYVLTICLVCGGFGLYDYIDYKIPVVGDGSLILADYIPFDEDSKLVKLEEEASLKLEDNLPKVDGATALFPVYSAFVQAVYPKEDYSIYKDYSYKLAFNDEEENSFNEDNNVSYLKCTKTSDAYVRLMDREADIIFVAGPSEAQLEAAEAKGVKMKFTPIGKEAFVFFVNAKNNVDSLTVSEIQDIYSGKITNWSEVGGKNHLIKAFQRPKNSGSQTSLEKFMDGKELMKPIEENIVDGMGGIIDKTASYKNYKTAIGYSFRYFSADMVKNNQIKHLAINGVKPTKESIKDGSYPISDFFYAVTLEDNDNPNVDSFIEWMIGEQGQYIIEETGYVGIK